MDVYSRVPNGRRHEYLFDRNNIRMAGIINGGYDRRLLIG